MVHILFLLSSAILAASFLFYKQDLWAIWTKEGSQNGFISASCFEKYSKKVDHSVLWQNVGSFLFFVLWILHNHKTEWKVFQVAIISHWDSYNGPLSHPPVHDSDSTFPMCLDLSCLWTYFPLNRTFLFQSAFSLPSTVLFSVTLNPIPIHPPLAIPIPYRVFLHGTFHLVFYMLYLLICYNSVPLARRKIPLKQGCWHTEVRLKLLTIINEWTWLSSWTYFVWVEAIQSHCLLLSLTQVYNIKPVMK